MKKYFMRISIFSVALLALGMLLSGISFAAADKVDVCHITGNDGLQLINISTRALLAHLDHGDLMPGEIISQGEPYLGLYGSSVTEVTLLGADCSQSTILRIEKGQNFQAGQGAGSGAGWAGWSCVETGYPHVVGGGVIPEDGTVYAQGPAKYGAAAIDTFSYPVYPHYTYNGGSNTPDGEEGWVVEAAGAGPGENFPTGIYVLCGE